MFNEEKRFMNAEEVSDVLGVSMSKAYKVIRQLNKEMQAKGFYTISGRVSTKYFAECFYGFDQ